MKYSQDLVDLISGDTWMMDVLKIVRNLGLNDCWIGAGFVRNKVWDYKHGLKRTALNDIDVIYYDVNNSSEFKDKEIENSLKSLYPDMNWSVKNQAEMNIKNNHRKYKNCEDAISFWPETATAIAVRIDKNNQVELIAPYGLDDLFNLIVRPTPNADLQIFKTRMKNKQWEKTWNKLKTKKRDRRD